MVGRRVAKKEKICITLIILWTAIIFSFSLQPGEISSQTSHDLSEWLVEEIIPIVIEDVEKVPMKSLEQLHFLLRKCAHFTEYFILGLLVKISLQHREIRRKNWQGVLYCICVASMDETIQLFVSGRSGRLSDVLLDSVGAVCGIGFLLLMGKIIRRTRQLRTESCM